MKKPSSKSIEIVQHTAIRSMSFFVQDTTFVPPHIHSDLEIICVMEGTLLAELQNEFFELSPGEIALFNPYQTHSCRSNSERCLLLVLQIDPSFCHSYYPQFQNIRFCTGNISAAGTPEQLSEIVNICFHIGYNYFEQKLGFEFRCISDVNRLFDYLLHTVPYTLLSNTGKMHELEQRMERILSYIDGHYTEKITLTEIAEMEGLSANYLSHFFKKHLNQSFQTYINSLRLSHAIYLLRNTDMRVLDICIESGFSDNKYLNKQMELFYHTTPLEFRRKHPPLFPEPHPIAASSSRSSSRRIQQRLSISESLSVLRSSCIYQGDNSVFPC